MGRMMWFYGIGANGVQLHQAPHPGSIILVVYFYRPVYDLRWEHESHLRQRRRVDVNTVFADSLVGYLRSLCFLFQYLRRDSPGLFSQFKVIDSRSRYTT